MSKQKWNEYLSSFDEILEGKIKTSPYDKDAYLEYVKLNKSRMNRWLKTGITLTDAKEIIDKIDEPQHWYVITEPWCGDAAHNLPFIYLLSEMNENIELTLILRDKSPEWMDEYLTNGSRSIPKLVVRDKNDADIFTWGPRPDECQRLVRKMKEEGVENTEAKKRTQQWYNLDKGVSVQSEILNKLELYLGMRS
ncbi:MAG: thioredoxin family protein [Crocinitomicaceae bacterium]